MALHILVGDIDKTAATIRRLPVASRVRVLEADHECAMQEFPAYLEQLRQHGLDVGKGNNHEFGYRKPVPPIDAIPRTLTIFRRNYGRRN